MIDYRMIALNDYRMIPLLPDVSDNITRVIPLITSTTENTHNP